jgi:Putative zinc-finger
MKCIEVRSLFSSYLDGVVSGKQMRSIADHLALCPSCSLEYDAARRTQALVASIGKRRAPSDMALRLRLAIQHERARKSGTLPGFLIRLEHAFNSFMLPATAGLVSAVIIFGLLIGLFAAPQLNAQNDVSTSLYLPPRLTSAPYGLIGVNEPVVLEAYVSSEGRVEDYRVISGPKESHSLRVQLDNALIFATFEPARAFGMPSSGRVVITFERRNLGI